MFLLDHGAFITAELTSTNCGCSPLIKIRLEIPCKINVKMLSALKNVKILNKFQELVADLYIEPESPQILGSTTLDKIFRIK